MTEVYHLLEKGYRMDRPEGCPIDVYHLMRRSWMWDPKDRPSFREARHKLDNMFSDSSVNDEVERVLGEGPGPAPIPSRPQSRTPTQQQQMRSKTPPNRVLASSRVAGRPGIPPPPVGVYVNIPLLLMSCLQVVFILFIYCLTL